LFDRKLEDKQITFDQKLYRVDCATPFLFRLLVTEKEVVAESRSRPQGAVYRRMRRGEREAEGGAELKDENEQRVTVTHKTPLNAPYLSC
jgi:hypothetical protein